MPNRNGLVRGWNAPEDVVRELSKYFSIQELACKKTGKFELNIGFAQQLLALRVAFDRPMVSNSCCRDEEYNNTPRKHGGVGSIPTSLHICNYSGTWHPKAMRRVEETMWDGTLAIDVSTVNGSYRGDLFTIAWRQGWSIGWNDEKNFLHLDYRSLIALPQNTFGY